MRIEKSVEQARSVTTIHQAAILYSEIDMELSLGFYGEVEWDLGDQAQRILEERFPGVVALSREVTKPPSLSRSATKGLTEGTPVSPVEGEQVSRQFSPRPPVVHRRKRSKVPALATLMVVGALYVATSGVLTSSNGCPSGTENVNTSLEEICNYPNGKTECVLSAFGLTPLVGQRELTYTLHPGDGPWCEKAHNFPG